MNEVEKLLMLLCLEMGMSDGVLTERADGARHKILAEFKRLEDEVEQLKGDKYRYTCNACADTENAYSPCKLYLPAWMGKPDVKFCPISADECEWDEPQQPKEEYSE